MTDNLEKLVGALLNAGGEPVSGEELARLLSITRAGVWKEIKALEAKGYTIESKRGVGYRLVASSGQAWPGEVLPRLTTRWMGKNLRHFEVTGSTNREAAKWAEEGAPDGSVVVADAQTQGKGRLGRAWFDNPGQSLLTSIVLRPDILLNSVYKITFVSALALAETFAKFAGEQSVEIKWPNDVLLNGRKAAGILLESRAEGAQVSYVVLGVGVNVGKGLQKLPPEVEKLSATLWEAAPNATITGVLCEFLARLEEIYGIFLAQGFSALLPRWEKFFRMAGREVTVTVGDKVRSGVVAGMDGDGALVLVRGDDQEKIFAGDVAYATLRK